MRFAKGHGTGNDFLILPDPDDAVVLSPGLVARLCDRRTGLGADGILRAVRTSAGDPAEWFMDYRNADGSIAEMCGNGVRVFARYLLRHGLAAGPEFTVATRAGLRQVREEASGEITVDMGAPVVRGRSAAVIGSRSYEGLEVSLGNPHLACVVSVPPGDIDLSAPPVRRPRAVSRRRQRRGAARARGRAPGHARARAGLGRHDVVRDRGGGGRRGGAGGAGPRGR